MSHTHDMSALRMKHEKNMFPNLHLFIPFEFWELVAPQNNVTLVPFSCSILHHQNTNHMIQPPGLSLQNDYQKTKKLSTISRFKSNTTEKMLPKYQISAVT